MGRIGLHMAAPYPQLFEYGVAGRALAGAAVSGDLSWVRQDGDSVHIAVIDGLGHGPEAAEAAASAVAALEASREQLVSRLMMDCHVALAGTRGAVIGLAELDARRETMNWLAVGNIAGRLVRPTPERGRSRSSLLILGGIVGHRLPHLHLSTVGFQPGDIVAMATDGIDSEFEREIRLDLPPRQAAHRILVRCRNRALDRSRWRALATHSASDTGRR
jgi:hypothetical protein